MPYLCRSEMNLQHPAGYTQAAAQSLTLKYFIFILVLAVFSVHESQIQPKTFSLAALGASLAWRTHSARQAFTQKILGFTISLI